MQKAQSVRASQAEVPTSGPFRALIVFVRFADDTFNHTCSEKWLAWRSGDRLPDMAHDFLVPARPDGRAPRAPFPENSLTEYFYQQSNQSFILYGEAYPEVIETRFDEGHYRISGSGARSQDGLAALTKEILDHVDESGLDFSEYDRNDDGFVDHIFIVPRRFDKSQGLWSGISSLGNTRTPILSYDGKAIDWNRSGSYSRYGESGNIIPLLTLGRLMAHEFGHDLWDRSNIGGVHLRANTENDVPSNGTNRVAYALMPGAGGADDMAGNETISAFERDLIGWIRCTPLQRDEQGVRIDGVYSSGDCRTIELDNGSTGKTLYLSNLQRDNYFDDLHIYNPDCFYAEDGLKSTGLLVGMRKGSGSNTRYDELPADNTLEISNDASTYAGDLYGPSTATQITPWTRPNSNGCTRYARDSDCDDPGFVPSWKAVDNIRYERGSSGPIIFDFIEDFRARPTIREDSWIGKETSGEIIRGNLIVESGAVLTIEPGTELRFARGRGVTVHGVLNATDVTFTASGTSWAGITFESGSDGTIIRGSVTGTAGEPIRVLDAAPRIEDVEFDDAGG